MLGFELNFVFALVIHFKDDRSRLLFCISNQFYAKFSWDKEFNRGCNLWGEFLNNFSNIFHFSCWWNSSGFIEKKTIIVKKIMIGTTGCPNKHGNLVTNWISSLLWIVIPNFKSHNLIMSAGVYLWKRGM